MQIWLVMDGDYDSDWVVAAYQSEDLAKEHEALMGGWIVETVVLSSLHPDAVDPVKQKKRAKDAEKAHKDWLYYQQRMEQDAKARAEIKPCPPHMGLCHCETFSDKPMWNAHGYCAYCGGFAPKVFVEHMGEVCLQGKIDELALHDRNRMRSIVAPLTLAPAESQPQQPPQDKP